MLDAVSEDPQQEVISRMQLRLMATTDLHMHLLPYDYLTDRPNSRLGLAQTAKLIQQARTEKRNTLLFDAGDFLHGTAMGDLVVERASNASTDADVHPMIAAMNHLRYDVATLGNHDFDRGVDVLLSAIEQAEFPIISANTVLNRGGRPSYDSTFVPPYTILNRVFPDSEGEQKLVRIGVIGFLPPNSIHSDLDDAPTLSTRDILEAARDFIPRLRAKGVDLVVALAHSGIGEVEPQEGMENAIIPLCALPGVDVVIGGHAHQHFPRPASDLETAHHWLDHPEVEEDPGLIHGKPVVVPGFWGSHLGVIDLDLEGTADGWRVVSKSANLREVAERGSEQIGPEFSTLLGQLHESTLTHVRTRIGYAHQDLNSYFSLVGADPSTRLVQQAMADFTCQLIEAGAAPDLPVLASSAAFKCGGLGGPGYYTSIDAGELTLRSVADLYIFPNELALVRANGAYLHNWLERSASVFSQVVPGQRFQTLKAPGTPGYLLESVLGLTYQIDLSQPARFSPSGQLNDPNSLRVRDLCYQGKPVAESDEFLLATSDFRIRGGGGFPIIDPSRIVPVKPISIRDLLRHFVEDTGRIAPGYDRQWSFAPVAGASVQFPSAPEARRYLEDFPEMNMRMVREKNARGFSVYELML
ncbi:bifunctional 2',3'-cyclic-nucleotide 2'-phosphodiesterase/3'-nucleotidase [Aliiroseovarius sp. KMU-50]|uniref:Bifunctional 2',3'-cyclic-nucleotide 2'-phosphodiesterase/3'-nucleotidase n=1 Tax=Aliiroseovarius salicola TaxID=3009082 RepID=A0ABT4VWF0_9RHOB|nr:bifunctional 2',3'-cyclic-nucleotide 2'-phosphodiesterase/3'-nucleotidase [Aliiroseovarius sp. KMU-50]MDA5092574.1 bifunctional 2',3'-cyclic-nucleotide 2'-phosphodiesterase/3'-nucleotidase [Aliiroseovarius sp. KMU-50]